MAGTTIHPIPTDQINAHAAHLFRVAATLLETQHADPYRVRAYRRGAQALDELDESVATVYRREGLDGLIALPAIGRTMGLAIVDLVELGHWRWLDRLQGHIDPERVLATLPTIGPRLAHQLHHQLGIDTLDELERAVYDGRLGRLRGIGEHRLHAIRDALTERLHPPRDEAARTAEASAPPSIQTLLGIDEEYRRKADLNELPTIAPHRFNPTGNHWLPVLHTTRDHHHYTAMFSNSARAHELGRTDDWVVIFVETPDRDGWTHDGWTVVTETHGPHAGQRVVRGDAPPTEQTAH